MSDTKSVIEIVKGNNTITSTDSHIAEITGEQSVRKPNYYRNTENGKEYSYIGGSIAWPGERSGFVVVVAVEKGEETLYVLAEAEALRVRELMSEGLKLRQKYGYGQHPDLFRFWYGDNERFATFVSDFNHELAQKDKEAEGIYLSPPYDTDKSNAFEIWLNRIHACLAPDATGNKTLYLGDCKRLRNHIQNLPHDAVAKASLENYPAITCLGGLVHSLMMLRPWMKFLNREETLPTVKDDYAVFAQGEHEQVMRDLWGDADYGDMEEYDDGELVSTV